MATSKLSKLFLGVLVFITTSLLLGCAAVHTVIAKNELDVQTKMSDSVFLEPPSLDNKIIFVEVKNASDKANFNIQNEILTKLANKGYEITQDPDHAYYWLRANILSVEKVDSKAADDLLQAGYGGSLTGAVAGTATGAALSGWSGAGIGGLAGAAAFGIAELVADAAFEDTTYLVIADVEIAERAKDGVIIREDSRQDAKQGLGGGRTQISSEITSRKKYRTRIISTANKVNLSYQEAAPDLTSGLVSSISGLF